jgi:hypothetical protein
MNIFEIKEEDRNIFKYDVFLNNKIKHTFTEYGLEKFISHVKYTKNEALLNLKNNNNYVDFEDLKYILIKILKGEKFKIKGEKL